MNNGIILENVHLLNARDSVHTQALEGVLQPLIVSGGCLMHSLLLSVHMADDALSEFEDPVQSAPPAAAPPDGALATGAHSTGHLHKLIAIHAAAYNWI